MAENQAAHRMQIEQLVVRSQQKQESRGQLFGFMIGLAGLGCATASALLGQPVFGGVIGGTTLVSLVSTFLYSQYQQKAELAQKRPDESGPAPQNPEGQRPKKVRR